jgi:hypothetical protein
MYAPDITAIITVAIIFAAFVPGVLLRLGSGYGKYAVAAIHAILFAVVLMFVYGRGALEGFQAKKPKGAKCIKNSECESGNCKEFKVKSKAKKERIDYKCA